MGDATSTEPTVWLDLSTPDVGGAFNFYQGLLGWELQSARGPDGDHHLVEADGRPFASIMAPGDEPAPLPAAWTVFVQVTRLEDVVAEVGRSGGTVLDGPLDIPAGRIAVVADPTGAMVGLISSDEPLGARLDSSHGSVRWIEVLTREPEIATPFYTAVLGWQAELVEREHTSYTLFTVEGEPVAGLLPMPDEVPAEAPSHWLVAFAVDDCAAAERRAIDLGGQVMRPTTQVAQWRFAVLADPAGAVFQVMERAD